MVPCSPLFYFGLSLLKQNSRKKGSLIKGLLGNLVFETEVQTTVGHQPHSAMIDWEFSVHATASAPMKVSIQSPDGSRTEIHVESGSTASKILAHEALRLDPRYLHREY